MKHILITVILALILAACSPREDQDAKSKPISIDQAQIDIAKMNQFFKDPAPSTNWMCFVLTKPGVEDDDAQWKRIKTMSHRQVLITAGREVLATGQISGILTSQDKFDGLHIAFPSPATAEALEAKLGIQRRPLPPSLK